MKTNIILKIAIVFLLFKSCGNPTPSAEEFQKKKDSIAILLKQSYGEDFSKNEKLQKLTLAYRKLISKKEDRIDLKQLSSIAYRFYKLNDTSNFFKANDKTIEIAKKRKDSFIVADGHWSYGEYHLVNESFEKAYYHYNFAYNYFNRLKKTYETGRMLYSMSFIKGRYRDYSGSEVLNIEAIKKFQKLNDNKLLYMSYSHLGTLQQDIKQYEKALKYQKKALDYINKLDNKNKFLGVIYNNIGNTYLQKEDYASAMVFFNKAIPFSSEYPNDFARVIDNRAFCRLKMNDTSNVKQDLLKALRIRDSLKNKTGITFSKLRLARYSFDIKDTLRALKYAKEASLLAKELKNGVDYLTSLELLSELDPKNSGQYLKEHIRYNDSLLQSERETVNKFTRIEFETNEIIETNEVLTKQRIWIFSASIGLILILSLLYFIRVQKVKNEKLFLETEQQKANEQVYLLTLKQQATLEEEKTKERNRISQELHDGILGRLFGTRVGLGFLDLNADEKTQEQHEAFLEELQDIEKEIREVSHKLNDNFASPDVNFTTIVTQLLESKSEIGDFQFHLNIDENISWKSTDEIIKVNVYRIIQETLQNTIKHAQAKNVTLDFSSNEKELSVLIKDDGVGFNQKKSRKGIGLKNMKSRVEKLNGTLEINTAVNKGTQIHIKIPVV